MLAEHTKQRKGNCYGTLLFQLQYVNQYYHMFRDGKTGHLPKRKLFNVKLRLMKHTDLKTDQKAMGNLTSTNTFTWISST